MNMAKSFWNRIDEILRNKQMTIAHLSRSTCISYDSFKAWRSRNRIPNIEALIKISNYLEISLDYLLKGESQEQQRIETVKITFEKKDETFNLVIGFSNDCIHLNGTTVNISNKNHSIIMTLNEQTNDNEEQESKAVLQSEGEKRI